MPKTIRQLAIALAIIAVPAAAGGDEPNGAELFTVCEVCHGERAQGNEDFGSPRLAGQHDWYLTTQLVHFRDGLRGTHEDDDNGQVMAPMAADLDYGDIADVVAYIMTLDPHAEITDED